MSSGASFEAWPSLLEGAPHPECYASVILPARNEEAGLSATLDAFAEQVDEVGRPLNPQTFELILLLNNCTDQSADAARAWKQAHPHIVLYVIERTLPAEQAHVGTARRLLMDTAWHRLQTRSEGVCAILSSDSDTRVAPDWITQNLRALRAGAHAVGGFIRLQDGELDLLPRGARRSYLADQRYQELVAELEDLLDPQPGDPFPRHLHHFGASLACTPEIYAKAGGLPPVKPLEDVAFVDALRRVDARLRHDPSVVVYTSSRLDGRAEIGLSHQLRVWQEMEDVGEAHTVPSATWLTHRFSSLRSLRSLKASATLPHELPYPGDWIERIRDAHQRGVSMAEFLGAIDCNGLIEATFSGVRETGIEVVNEELARTIQLIKDESASEGALISEAVLSR